MSKCPAEGKGSCIKSGLLSGRCFAAVLIVAVLAISCFVLMNDSNESEAVSYPNEVYVPYGYATTESDKISNGETKTYSGTEQARYENGTLTITDFVGTSYNGTHTENGITAGIYANGSITLVFDGSKTSYLLFDGNSGSRSFGIYVNGDLTIINRVSIDSEVRFGGSNLASAESAGIYCTGKLTVINDSSGHSFTLHAKGHSQSFESGSGKSSFKTYGILCGLADFNKMGSIIYENELNLTAIGGDISACPQSGTVESVGLKSINGAIDVEGNTNIKGAYGGTVNISGYTNGANPVISAGIYTEHAFTYNPIGSDCSIGGSEQDKGAVGGKIYMDSGSTYGDGGVSYGIHAGTLSLSGSVEATGGLVPLALIAKYADSYGIWVTNFTGDDADITAVARDASSVSCGFYCANTFDSGNGSTIECTSGAAHASNNNTYSIGLRCMQYAGGDGSVVTGTGGTVCYGDRIAAGVMASTIVLSGDAKLTGVGGDTFTNFTPSENAFDGNTILTGGDAASTYGIYVYGNTVQVNGNSVLSGTGGTINPGETDANRVTAGVYLAYSAQVLTISGSGTIEACGGSVARNTADNLWTVSAGIHSSRELIIDGTNIVAEGGTVCTESDVSSAYKGSRSYGLYAPSLSIVGEAEVSAEGGANGCYSTTDGSSPKYNDSIGIYVTGGNLSVSGGSSITATGKGSQRIIGIIVNGNISVEGGSTITANVPANESRGYITNFDGIGKASIGIYLSNDESSFSVPSGTVTLIGTTQAIRCTSGNTGTFSGVEALWTSDSLTGEGAEIIASSTNIADVSSVYVKMDNTFSVVFGGGWTYGNDPTVPEFSNEDRVVSVNYLGTDVFGDDYDSSTPPTNAGNYSLKVIYDGDREKIIGFTISPRTGGTVTLSATWHYYNGTEQVALPKEVKWNGEVIDSKEYHGTAGDITFTTPGNYSVTLTLDKNYVGTKVYNYTVDKATASESMFNILPLADVEYTGNPVVVSAPTPKVPTLSGYGSITVLYNGSDVAPTNVGTYSVTFKVEGGDYVDGRTLYLDTFDITPYTVSFNGNGGGSSMPDVTNAAGDYELPRCRFTAPEHMHFSQWAVGSEEGPRYDAYAHIQVLNDVTLYAIWAYDVHTITFRASGGTGEMDQASMTYGQEYTLPENGFTAPDHKEFKCWVIDEVEYPAGAKITIEKNIEVWVEWVYVKYTVSATIDHGTVDLPTQKVEYLSDSLEITFRAAAGYVIRSYFIYPSSTNILERPSVWSFTVERVTGDVNLSVSTLPTFTVTWKSYDGETELEVDTDVPHGTAVSFDGSAPTLAPTVQYTYTFAGWATDKEQSTGTAVGSLPYVTGNVTYYAAFSAKANKYWVTFNNYNGVALQSDQVEYGAMPEYRSGTPTRSADAQHVYTFAGWDPEITAVTGPVTYTATYSEDPRPYTITFKNYDGTTLQSEQVGYGSVPAYRGSEPTKAATAEYSFTFNGWTPAIASVTGDATYTATFSQSVRSYTIKFVNGDDVLQSDVLEYGSMPEYRGEIPTKAADAQYTYTFREWTPGLSTVRGDATYTATYTSTVNKYTVTFKNGDDVLQSGLIEYGQTPDYTESIPTKAATAQYTYTFAGWATVANSEEGDDVDDLPIVSGNVTYYAAFSKTVNKYAATFDLNGGSVESTPTGWTPSSAGRYTKDFDFGTTKADIIDDFGSYSREGYSVTTVDSTADTMGAAGMIITVNWEINQYEVTFNLGGYLVEPPYLWSFDDGIYTKNFDFGTPLADVLADFGDYSREGYFKDPETSDVTTVGVNGMKITAHWTIITYRVDLNLDGGAFADAPDDWAFEDLGKYHKSFDYNTPYATIIETIVHNSVATDPVKEGYTFTGWSPNTGNLTTGTAVLTAHYSVNKYTATFDLNGGSVASDPEGWSLSGDVYTKDFDFGTSAETIISNFGGYTRTGFDRDTEETSADAMGIAGMTITAKWLEHALTVTFDANGGTGEMSQQVIKYSDAVKNLASNAFTRAGYIFTGWNTLATGSGTGYINGQNMAALITSHDAALTLHAQWEEKPKFTVTLPTGEGYVVSAQPGSVSPIYEGESFSFTVTHATGYEGTLVVKANDDILSAVDGVYTISDITEDKTVTVTGAQLKKLTVTFHRNGGTSGEMSAQTVDYNTPTNLTLNAFRYYGYNFTGWNTNYGGTGTAYADGAPITITENVTLYARWAPKLITVTLNPNEGTVSPTALDITYGTNYELPIPSYHGHNFAGWWIEGSPSQKINNSGTWNVREIDVELVAHWTTMPVHNMTFSGGAGSEGSMSAILVIEGESFDLPDCEFTKTGYHFHKWSCNAVEYDAGHTIENVTAPMEFVAVWEANVHKVTVHYVYAENLAPVRDDIVQQHGFGTGYEIYSDILTGYTADQTVVSGIMPDEDVEVTVRYTMDASIVVSDGDVIGFVSDGESAVIDLNSPSVASALADATKTAVEVSGNGWTMDIPKEIIAGATGQVSVSAQTMDDAAKAALPAAIKERVAGKTVYSLDLSDANGMITFTGKKITVSLPYTLAAGESADNVKVFCINGENLEEFDATYDSTKKVAVFETEHFSDWFVDVVESPSSSGSNGGGFPIWVIFVIIAVVAAAGAGAFFVVKNKKA